MEGGPPVFPADSTCPQVLRIPLVPSSFRLHDCHILRLRFPTHSTTALFLNAVLTPGIFLLPVWPAPLSLATTRGISVDYFSSAYLDVSVRRVPSVYLLIQYTVLIIAYQGVSPFGYLRILRLFAPPRSFSQLVASFIGSQCQGILLVLFLA